MRQARAGTTLATEIAGIPDAVARLLEPASRAAIEREGAALRALDPRLVATIARGSSDHAALYLKYAIEIGLGLPVASLGPSVASVYGRALRLDGAVALAISQSGSSDDIVVAAGAARGGGARTVGLLNTLDSPLGRAVEATIDIAAGDERAVAATKSYVATVAAGLALVAAWGGDEALARDLDHLPRRLSDALAADATGLADALAEDGTTFVLGRGCAFALAEEAALKRMEVVRLPALAYSGAEVLHGPATLVERGARVVSFAERAGPGMAATHERLAEQGARLSLLGEIAPQPAAAHPLVAPLPWIAAFYAAAERAARMRGVDPDRPPHLAKETVTR